MEGRLNKAYRNTATIASPTQSLIGRITDVKITRERGSSEFNYRGSENVKTATGKKKYGVTFKYETKRDPSVEDLHLAALLDSFENDTMLDLAFTDQAIATVGAKGIRGPFVVVSMPKDEAEESNSSYDVTLAEIDYEDGDGVFEVTEIETSA